MGTTLAVLKPKDYTYVKCVENPMNEKLKIGRFYQVMPGNKIKKGDNTVGHSLAKFELISDAYFNTFK